VTTLESDFSAKRPVKALRGDEYGTLYITLRYLFFDPQT